MKIRIACVLVLISLVSGCLHAAISEQEAEILKTIGFNSGIVSKIKDILKTEFTRYETADPGYLAEEDVMKRTGIVEQDGISFQVQLEKQDALLERTIQTLRDTGYIPFISMIDFSENKSYLTVIKSKDQLDIVRLEKTDGINYGITNKDLITRLKAWNEKYGIRIIGASYDWVDFRLVHLPPNIGSFAKEVYSFCPDSIDQGVGSMEELIREIKTHKRLFLWWD